MRAVIACLLALAVIAGGAPGASAKKRPASACQKLAKGRKDLAPGPKLVAVVRGSDETGRISACVLPRGYVRTLASWDDGLARDAAGIVATAGTWALVDASHNDQYGGTARSLTRVDVASGRRLALSSFGCFLEDRSRGCPDGSSYGRVAIASSGAGAYELTDLAAGTTTLRAFDAAGAFTTLADGSVDALRVTRTLVVWTQAGVEHSAPLP